MDVTEKYGKTNTVANICKAYGVPLEVGFIIADGHIHNRGRFGYWAGLALQWIFVSLSVDERKGFRDDLDALAVWMHEQWAKAK